MKDLISLIDKNKIYQEGSVKQVYLLNPKEIIKVPKFFKNENKNMEQYKIFLSGVNQILTEINIWNNHKEFEDILCPILNYQIYGDYCCSVNKKIIPSNIYINEKDFNLKYFCKKINYNYNNLFYLIEKFADIFNLDLYDLIENETNFGIDIYTHKILLLDYGFKEKFNYNNINSLKDNNKSLIIKIMKKEV